MKISVILLTVIFLIISTGCGIDDDYGSSFYRDEMRSFVQDISSYARTFDPSFIVIPQNGHELLTENGDETGEAAQEYIQAIDGVGREDLFYGYTDDNVPTPASERDYMTAFMDIAESEGVEVLVTDYCLGTPNVDDSYALSTAKSYISFAADHRELDNVPSYPSDPVNVNTADISSLAEAQNFLYLLNPSDNAAYTDKDTFITALQSLDYDVLIIDLFFDGTEPSILTSDDVDNLRLKATGGGNRLVIAYMSIGEAEDYRYYWQPA